MAVTVEIYTWSRCPFCIRAKELLDRKGVEYSEYCIDGDEEARGKMKQRANGRSSVPQIFIDERHIGGCDDLYALENKGELDSLLAVSGVIMAATVEIYTWSRCPFCIRAKGLLDRKGVEYSEYCIDGDEEARGKMKQRANGRSSVPQIFIDERHIGGCDDLYALENKGELDSLLTGSAA